MEYATTWPPSTDYGGKTYVAYDIFTYTIYSQILITKPEDEH